jgi:hypothetical protein
VGRAADPVRGGPARINGGGIGSGEVSGPEPETALPDVANVPRKPHARHCRPRLLRGRAAEFPAALLLCRASARPSAGGAFQRDPTPDRALDGPANRRSVPLLQRSPSLHDTRSRPHLRSGFLRRVKHMGIEDVVIAPRSPWQSPYVQRLIGSIRRECLDHLIAINEAHLRRILTSYFAYYHRSRVHLSLERNTPVPRRVEHPSVRMHNPLRRAKVVGPTHRRKPAGSRTVVDATSTRRWCHTRQAGQRGRLSQHHHRRPGHRPRSWRRRSSRSETEAEPDR